MKTARSLLVVLAVATGAACAQAGGDATGGDLTPAGYEAVTPGAFTPPETDGGGDCGTGTKWSELYRDIFGPTGKPSSCSFASNCHGTPESEGAQSQAGIQCFDENGCRLSMAAKRLARPSDRAHPENSILLGILRIRTAQGTVTGIMPKSPGDYVFPTACIDRIKGWMANGVPAD